jgi:hypothetical protein
VGVELRAVETCEGVWDPEPIADVEVDVVVVNGVFETEAEAEVDSVAVDTSDAAGAAETADAAMTRARMLWRDLERIILLEED